MIFDRISVHGTGAGFPGIALGRSHQNQLSHLVVSKAGGDCLEVDFQSAENDIMNSLLGGCDENRATVTGNHNRFDGNQLAKNAGFGLHIVEAFGTTAVQIIRA